MKKNLFLLGLICLLTLGIWAFADIKSVDEYYLAHAEDITEDSETVTLAINCASVNDHWDKLEEPLKDRKYVPEDGIVLEETKFVLRPGDTVFSILKRACKARGIPMEYQGAEKNAYGGVYIQGIHYLYDHSCGPLSGWMFRVNETYPGVGCGQYRLQKDDRIEWIYTCELGRDIGNEYNEEKEAGK